MFVLDLKHTNYEPIPDYFLEITGENYVESEKLFRIYYKVEDYKGRITPLSKPSFKYNIEERKIATLLNDSLLDVIWDRITISELENHLKNSILKWNDGDFQFRLEFNVDLIFGWVHYKIENKTKTFRFKINKKGRFSKC